MKISRKRLVAVLALVAAAGAALLFCLSLLAHKNREVVRQEVRKVLGDDASFETVEATLWTGFGFRMKDFRIADDARFAATPLVQARELHLGISLWHLLLGRLVITTLTFTEPELQIITNEAGLLNMTVLAERKQGVLSFSRLGSGAGEKRSSGVSFLITRLKVVNGRADFIDRSITAPAALQIKKIDLDVGGLDLAARAKIKLAASLTADLGQDVRITGEMGPPAPGKNWTQQPVNLDMQFDSLYLPMLARAIPFFRDRIPREFDITGPMHFNTKLTGTLLQPRFTALTLKVPLLGSSEYNAVLEGQGKLTEDSNWGEAPIAGKLTLSAVSLSQLRKLPLMGRIFPDDLITDGAVDIRSRFEGTWNQLRVGALLEASGSELGYLGQFRKPAGKPAQLRARITGHNGGYLLHSSELVLGELKILVSGAVTQGQNPRLSVRLQADKRPVKALQAFLKPASLELAGGSVGWDLSFQKELPATDATWETRGVLALEQVALRDKVNRQNIDRLSGSVSFYGRRARANNLTLRVGSTPLSLAVDVTELAPFRAGYSLRSDNLIAADLPLFPKASGFMSNVLSNGELTMAHGEKRLRGVLTSAAGTLQDVPYRNLQTDLTWSPAGISFKDLRLEVFDGALRAAGSWNITGGKTRELRILSKVHALSLAGVLAQLAPQIKDRFAGRLDFGGEFAASAALDAGAMAKSFKGSGMALIRKGTIKDFNLIAQLFYGGAGTAQNTDTSPRLARNLPATAKPQDTAFEELKANVTVEARRVRTDNLSLSTREYAITGAGWVAFDGTTQWNGLLVFSPVITRELQREYGAIRYFLDRQGRLAISFRLDGKLPNVRIRPENRALSQALRWGTWQRSDDLAGREGRSGRTWLPESLDRLLHR